MRIGKWNLGLIAVGTAILFATFPATNVSWSQAQSETASIGHEGIWGWDWMQASFTDYFNDGNDNGWTQLNRRWRVSKGRYVLDGDYLPNAIGRDGFSVIHVGDTTWRDYMFEATFDNQNPSGLPVPTVHDTFFFFRVQSPPPDGVFYRLEVQPKGAGSACCGQILTKGSLDLERWENGALVKRVFVNNSNSVIGTNTINILVHDNTIRIWINGMLMLNTTDDNVLEYGGVGLGAVWESPAWFDNVRVIPVK